MKRSETDIKDLLEVKYQMTQYPHIILVQKL